MEQETGRKGRPTYAITRGEFFDRLYDINVAHGQEIFSKMASKMVGGESKGAIKPLTYRALEDAQKTLAEIYDETNVKSHLSDADKKCLAQLEAMPSYCPTVLRMIRNISEPWWLKDEYLGDETTLTVKFRTAISHRLGNAACEDKTMLLASYMPFQLVRRIDTDDIPKLAEELDYPYAAFCILDIDKVRYYSNNKDVDRSFVEMKFLSSNLQNLVRCAVENEYKVILGKEGGYAE